MENAENNGIEYVDYETSQLTQLIGSFVTKTVSNFNLDSASFTYITYIVLSSFSIEMFAGCTKCPW